MAFIHDEQEIGQRGKILEIALPDVFLQPFDVRRLSAAHLGVASFSHVEKLASHSKVIPRRGVRPCPLTFRDIFEEVCGCHDVREWNLKAQSIM